MKWSAARIDRLAAEFLLWDAGKAEGEPIPEPLRQDLQAFLRWLLAQHEAGPDGPVAWRALRAFGLRQDA
jgi:hypothetical protein